MGTVELNEKVAVVTGAGRGLGRAYATELARRGAAVVVNDVDAEAARSAVEEIVAAGGRAAEHVGPVGAAEVADEIVATATETFGRLDILVTNAGIIRDTVLWKMSDADFDDVVRVHLRGTFTCVRAAATVMRAQGDGGRIICIGSPTGQVGNFGQGNYAAAKAGIVGMVRTWALELARAGITVNAAVPIAATEMSLTVPALQSYTEAVTRGEELPTAVRHELGFGSAADAAGVIAFLASAEAATVTGQVVGIGGDRLALWSHPSEIVVDHRDGGWDATAIAQAWPRTFADAAQPVGLTLAEVGR